jgi:hypothetical protein
MGARTTTHSAKQITELFGDEKENETEYPSKRASAKQQKTFKLSGTFQAFSPVPQVL